MEHPDEILDSAGDYAEHASVCEVCMSPGIEMCDEGVRLMNRFHTALNDSLVKGVTN